MSTPRDNQLNVLVIDDNADVRELLVEVISRYDHQVVPASSAEEALALLPYWTFEVAFLDQMLPGLEGLLLGEYLLKNNPDMTIALVTGQTDPQLERRSRDLSIRFIAKPFEVSEIVSVIEEHQAAVRDRELQRQQCEDPSYVPSFVEYVDELTEIFGVPNIPSRIGDGVVETIKRGLSDLRSHSRYTERGRVAVLSGLLAAKVLGLSLPKTASGTTLYEEYDQLMREGGRRTEFSEE